MTFSFSPAAFQSRMAPFSRIDPKGSPSLASPRLEPIAQSGGGLWRGVAEFSVTQSGTHGGSTP